MKNILLFSAVVLLNFLLLSACMERGKERFAWDKTKTFAGTDREFGEPFGLAVKDGDVYVSDGEQGKIWRVSSGGKPQVVTEKLNTPSGIAIDDKEFLIVVDSGSHTVKRINVESGEVRVIAGIENKKGYADGDAAQALFNAPVGVATAGDKIYVADTYNDKIRVIENGKVSTLAGGEQGFADSDDGLSAKFDSPSGIAVAADGGLIVADTRNRRIRRIETSGTTSTLAGTGDAEATDGFLFEAAFVEPTALAVDVSGTIYVADGNAVRAIGRRFFPLVETLTKTKRGYSDGSLPESLFNRPSGLAFDKNGSLFVADAENQTVRVLTGENTGAEITPEQTKKLRFTADEFRRLQPARWTYNPPETSRDVAGTLGEIRGEITDGKNAWFHNGLDVAGAYGETARFVRGEKVLRLSAVENLATARELIRMPTMGYIHIRLGRDVNNKLFDDARFQFSYDQSGKIKNLRVARGARFEAGEALGTLNAMNHVHLIAGRAGAEMNALDALEFPNISDTVAPKIEKVAFFEEDWRPIETEAGNQRIKLKGKTRVVVRAFDQMNGNAAYRKLGVYRLGYQILRADQTPVSEMKWTISFARYPDESAVRFVYARGSQSGYSPVTVFDYIVTNEVRDDVVREDFLDAAGLEAGDYILRMQAADFFGNNSVKDLNIVISR